MFSEHTKIYINNSQKEQKKIISKLYVFNVLSFLSFLSLVLFSLLTLSLYVNVNEWKLINKN